MQKKPDDDDDDDDARAVYRWRNDSGVGVKSFATANLSPKSLSEIVAILFESIAETVAVYATILDQE